MGTKDSSSNFGDLSTDLSSSEKFIAMVNASVDFGPDLGEGPGLREQIVRFAVLGRPEKAVELAQVRSTMSEGAARTLVENIGIAADHVFYATGLRP